MVLTLPSLPSWSMQRADEDWIPPHAVADLHRDPQGTIYWTAELRSAEVNTEPALWRIELDDHGNAVATERIVRPELDDWQANFLGMTSDGGAWWWSRCTRSQAAPWCDQIVRTRADGSLLGWAPPLVGHMGSELGPRSVDRAGDLVLWQTQWSEQPHGAEHETVFQRWRLSANDLSRLEPSEEESTGNRTTGSP